jgi:hypothetical protein
MFGAIGILAATRIMSRGRHPAARKRWMIVAARAGTARPDIRRRNWARVRPISAFYASRYQ